MAKTSDENRRGAERQNGNIATGAFAHAFEELSALARFAAIPLLVVLLFAGLAFVTYDLDASLNKSAVHQSGALIFLEQLFGDGQSTRDLLSTLASALITVTSITFSLLLVAVQQSASTFSNQILDQFLHRKSNQFYFGFFIGLSLFTLVELATTKDLHHPLFGALVAIVLSIVALVLILVLIWTTIDQIRSANVIGNIGSMIRSARSRDRRRLARTRGQPRGGFPCHRPVRHPSAGIVSDIALHRLEKIVHDLNGDCRCEMTVAAPTGTYVGNGDTIAELVSDKPIDEAEWQDLAEAIVGCWSLRSRPRAQDDARIGMHQLATIGWNSTSSARSNPNPSITVCRTIGELLWAEMRDPPERDPRSLIVYPDKLPEDGIDTLETVTTAAAEARQHQTAAAAYDAYARLLPILSERLQQRVARAVAVSIPALATHVPTRTLHESLVRLGTALREIGSPVAKSIDDALKEEGHRAAFSGDVRVERPDLVSSDIRHVQRR